MDIIEALLWGFGTTLFIFTLAGGIGGRWTHHNDRQHKRPHVDDGPSPLDIDDWER